MSTSRNKGSVNVCVFCGSQNPEIPSPLCAHGKTARVTGDALQVAARLWIASQAVEAHRAAFGAALDLAVKTGAASVDECPPVRACGNVRFTKDREIVVRDELRPVRLA